jgi:hypothetical protein
MVKLKLMLFASVNGPDATVAAVAELFDTLTTGVPVTVRPVTVVDAHTVPVPLTVIFPVPKARVREENPLLKNDPAVSVNVLRLSVPAVSVVLLVVPRVNALPSVHAPPVPLKVMSPFMVVPFVVTVLPVVVALNVIAPVADHTVPVMRDIEPLMASVGVVPLANATVPAETVMSRHSSAPVIVTV